MARVGPAQDERLSQAFYEAWTKFLDAEGNGKGKRRDETITLGFQGGWAAAFESMGDLPDISIRQAARIVQLEQALRTVRAIDAARSQRADAALAQARALLEEWA